MSKTVPHCDFLTDLSRIPGLGEKRIAAFYHSEIKTVGDLLFYFPRRYIDRTVITPLGECRSHEGVLCCVAGTITRMRTERGRRRRLRIELTDETGTMEAIWFHNVAGMQSTLRKGSRVLCTGKISNKFGPSMVHPDIEKLAEGAVEPAIRFMPVYSVTDAMRTARIGQHRIFSSIRWALSHVASAPRILPSHIEDERNFPPRIECIAKLHIPDSLDTLDTYRDRLRYEELFSLAKSLHFSAYRFSSSGRKMDPGTMLQQFEAVSPFRLSTPQKKVLQILYDDAVSGMRMHRLLHGDVGSGKTVTGFCATLGALNSGYQVLWMAPTEVLASQTYSVVEPWCRALGITVCLYTASTDPTVKHRITGRLRGGERALVIGTHALFQPRVVCARLGMIVIDEQHRFGAAQRLTLQQKDPRADFLLMSATPIPQTLCRTLYGDLQTVVLEKGEWAKKKRIATHVVAAHRRKKMCEFIRDTIDNSEARALWIVPRVFADHEEDTAGLTDIKTAMKRLRSGPCSRIPAEALHGQCDTQSQQRIIRQFGSGEIRLLVATTIVEVGMDVPQTDIIVVENAERFGLAQLHQLRGRCARGEGQGYCFLLPGITATDTAMERLNYFCTEKDGFRIAEKDLHMRGPGHVAGLRQSGWERLLFADILRDAALFENIQQKVAAHFHTAYEDPYTTESA